MMHAQENNLNSGKYKKATKSKLGGKKSREPTTNRLTAGRYKPSIACYLSIISNSIRIYGRATIYGLPYRP